MRVSKIKSMCTQTPKKGEPTNKKVGTPSSCIVDTYNLEIRTTFFFYTLVKLELKYHYALAAPPCIFIYVLLNIAKKNPQLK